MASRISARLSKSPRLAETQALKATWPGIELTVATENIKKPTVWKIHENRHALIVHLDGKINKIDTEIDRFGSKLHPPVNGEFWLIPANAKYFTYTQGDAVRYAEFYFDVDYLETVLGEEAAGRYLVPRIGQFNEFLYQNVRELVSVTSKTDDLSRLIGANISQTLCLHLFSNYNSPESSVVLPVRRFTPETFSLLQEYIFDNITTKIRLQDLAQLAETSEHNLLRTFSHSFGKTPAQYIIEQRLRRSRWLLANTKKDITTIALETGFSSHSHLTSTFKKQLGITPQDFRMRC
ncbi:MAG: AraC family transcriptional regulator [Acidobacteria bacterium ACB1]|nr:AraC family transcriptional regulator [Acidobacteria bacterium ACB1]